MIIAVDLPLNPIIAIITYESISKLTSAASEHYRWGRVSQTASASVGSFAGELRLFIA